MSSPRDERRHRVTSECGCVAALHPRLVFLASKTTNTDRFLIIIAIISFFVEVFISMQAAYFQSALLESPVVVDGMVVVGALLIVVALVRRLTPHLIPGGRNWLLCKRGAIE